MRRERVKPGTARSEPMTPHCVPRSSPYHSNLTPIRPWGAPPVMLITFEVLRDEFAHDAERLARFQREAQAGRQSSEVIHEDLCFDARQAAERAIKAVLVHRQVPFPRTHAIAGLLTLLLQAAAHVPEGARQGAILRAYAHEAT